MKDYRLLINGELINGASSLEVVNPANGEVIASAPKASVEQLNQAVEAANSAFPQWSRLAWEQRAKAIKDFADAIDAHANELTELLTTEQGKPLAEANAEVGACGVFLRYFAGLSLGQKVIEDSNEAYIVKQQRPLGVVAAIVPWNFPLLILCAKLGPALVTGNTVVVKPSPTTPLTTLRLGELAAQIFPRGVVNIIVDNNDLGSVLTSHPDVRKVTFTGSTATGKKVMASGANSLKRLTLELGGNDAAIILDDVDVEAIAPAIFQFAMFNNGQTCIAIKRIYVHESIYDRMVNALATQALAAVVADGLKTGSQVGPMHNNAQFEKTLSYISELKRANKVVVGGERVGEVGFFVTPAIVRDVTNKDRVVYEEQFGPILPLIKFKTDEEAIELANDSEYGLGGSVWSSNQKRALAIATQLNTGTVWVNKHLDFRPNVPVAGAKFSGIGVEFSEDALTEFTQDHIINAAR